MGTNILTQTRIKPRRMSIHCNLSCYVFSSNCDHSYTRSFFCFSDEYELTGVHWKWLLKGFKLARVLDINTNSKQAVYCGLCSIPSKLEALIHIRYLTLDFYRVERNTVIPDSICNLWNLETLDLGFHPARVCIVFPSGMWKLRRLRHIHIGFP